MLAVDVDTLTLDTFIAFIAKIELLKMWQSDNEQVRNHLTIYAMQRELEVQKQAGVPVAFGEVGT